MLPLSGALVLAARMFRSSISCREGARAGQDKNQLRWQGALASSEPESSRDARMRTNRSGGPHLAPYSVDSDKIGVVRGLLLLHALELCF